MAHLHQHCNTATRRWQTESWQRSDAFNHPLVVLTTLFPLWQNTNIISANTNEINTNTNTISDAFNHPLVVLTTQFPLCSNANTISTNTNTFNTNTNTISMNLREI